MSNSSDSIRNSLVDSAVNFLQDPNVAQSPLAKRIAFLESKGLNTLETQEAIRRSNLKPLNQIITSNQNINNPDWRDWFIISVVGGGIGYLLINLTKKYLAPALKPPNQTQLQEAQLRLEEKYDQADQILKLIQSDTQLVKNQILDQSQKLNSSIKQVETAIEDCLSGELKRDDEIKKIHQEVIQIKESIPRLLATNKEAQTISINELQAELKSLKSLLTTRPGPSNISNSIPALSSNRPSQTGSSSNTFAIQAPSNSPSLSRYVATRPPGIPSWQLASTTTTSIPNNTNINNDPPGLNSNSNGSTPSSLTSPLSKSLSYTHQSPTLTPQQALLSPKHDIKSPPFQLNDDDDDLVLNGNYKSDDPNQLINSSSSSSAKDLFS